MINGNGMNQVTDFVQEEEIVAEFGEWMKEYEIASADEFKDVLETEGKTELLEKFIARTEMYGRISNEEKTTVPPGIIEKVRSGLRTYLDSKENDIKYCSYEVEDPISLEQAHYISTKMSKEFDSPCFVYSACEETNCTGLQLGEYTSATVQVTMSMNQGEDLTNRYQLWRTYEKSSGDHPKVRFITKSAPQKWELKSEKSKKFERYMYLAKSDQRQIILLSKTPLEIGREYQVTGYCFESHKFDDLQVNLGTFQSTFLSFHEADAWAGDSISDEILEKCADGGRNYVIDSMMYPWHHSIPDYKELWASNFYSLDTGFPYNLMVIGQPGLTKSAVLDKIEAVTGETQTSGGGTLKGLIASFSSSNLNAGHLGEARDKALVNEFFELINNASKDERYTYLNRMKDVLEGKKTPIRSGNGTIRMVMTADMCAVSNPPRKQGGTEFQSVIDMYEKFEDAWMDRMLFYWIPADQQRVLKEEWEDWADERMEAANDDYAELEYEDYLEPDELYEILRYVRNVDWENTASDTLKQVKEDLMRNHVPNTVTASRLRKQLLNMASGFAVIRYLANGELPEEDTFLIEPQDVRQAKSLMVRVLKTYSGEGLDSRGSKVSQLPQDQFELYSLLKDYHHKQDKKHAKKITIAELEEKTNIDALREKLEDLAEQGLIVVTADEVMWMPEFSDQVQRGLRIIKEGGEISKEKNWVFKVLSRNGLVSYNDERGQYYLWDNEDESEKSVKSLKDHVLALVPEDGIEYVDLLDAVESRVSDLDTDDLDQVMDELYSEDEIYDGNGGKICRLD